MHEANDSRVGYTTDSYFQMVSDGRLSARDHVELLDGIIVAEPPQDPPHATGTTRVYESLRTAIGNRAVIRVQLPLVLGEYSAPEPDVAIVPGPVSAYETVHPASALLVVEVADSSLPKDRLSKSRIYAAAGVPEYWLVNLRDRQVEVFRRPNREARVYAECTTAERGAQLSLVAFPDTFVEVSALFPAGAP
jgi:Uma2 family endonuclease